MEFPQEKEGVQYTLVYVIMKEGNSMSSGNYCCNMLYFKTGI